MATTSTSDMASERSKKTEFLQSNNVASEPILIRTADARLLQGELADVPGDGRCLIVGDTPSFAARVRLQNAGLLPVYSDCAYPTMASTASSSSGS